VDAEGGEAMTKGKAIKKEAKRVAGLKQKRKPKYVPIVAWTVCCRDGKCHCAVSENDVPMYKRDLDNNYPCGPHVVVKLTGRMELKGEEKA
jgi:hypothetical protein